MPNGGPAATPQWAALERHATEIAHLDLRRLFAEDPGRVDDLTFRFGDWRVDASKNLITVETVELLLDLANAVGVPEARQAMWDGHHINSTENRAVMHPALRAVDGDAFIVDGRDVVPDVLTVRAAMADFATRVRSGEWKGHGGEPISTVVNIGIGGSDLGPAMAAGALTDRTDAGPDVRFVSNVDPSHLADALVDARPDTTLFVVVSKTFTTAETMSNARRSREWIVESLGADAVTSHFVAASSATDRAVEFGIDADHVFGFWDWVGGRYSLCSAVGLALMLAIGPNRFDDLLAGARDGDLHWVGQSDQQNVPLLAALIGVWNRNFLGMETHAVVPYLQRLERFPAFLQQLDMESNGKRVRLDGTTVDVASGPIVWGEPGTNGQHAFFQLLHQGTSVIPVDFIGTAHPHVGLDPEAHRILVGNMFAQSAALAFGRTPEELRDAGCPEELVAHRTFPGNRPSTTLLADQLDARRLGQLVAFYEHRTFAQGALWGVGSFDQWGVELGKELARPIIDSLSGAEASGTYDPSTEALIAAVIGSGSAADSVDST